MVSFVIKYLICINCYASIISVKMKFMAGLDLHIKSFKNKIIGVGSNVELGVVVLIKLFKIHPVTMNIFRKISIYNKIGMKEVCCDGLTHWNRVFDGIQFLGLGKLLEISSQILNKQFS